MLVKMVLLIVACEALVELLIEAEILNRPRTFIKGLSWFTNELFSCPYCVSVWCGGLAIIGFIYWEYCWWIAGIFVIHRLSNFVHNLFGLVRDFQITLRLGR